MQSFLASRLGPVAALIATLATLPVLASSTSSSKAAVTDPILEIFTDSLTTYLASGASNIQDIRPQAGHRGTNLEGTYRAAPSQRMAIRGNPFENVWSESQVNGVRLLTGTYGIQDVDLVLPAEGFSWVIGRSYNARQETSGAAHRDSDGYQGKNWFQNSQPEIVLHEHATDDEKDVLYLVYGADRYAEYKRVDIGGGTSNSFKGTNGAAGVFQYAAGTGSEPDTYTLTDQNGNEIVFFGFDGDADPAEGQIWKITDPADNTAYVGHATTASTAISNGFNASGYITEAYDTSGRR